MLMSVRGPQGPIAYRTLILRPHPESHPRILGWNGNKSTPCSERAKSGME